MQYKMEKQSYKSVAQLLADQTQTKIESFLAACFVFAIVT